ncbi:MAG: hypothetical protein GF307_12655 [candidate division Zixibacteria bacterium]|nr:hypothetical protein [candidate division Zixibacteria bacterium]
MKNMLVMIGLVLALIAGCAQEKAEIVDIRHFPLDNTQNLIMASIAEVDTINSIDGGGAVKFMVEDSTTVKLFELNDVDVEETQLVYQAKLKSENLDGNAYLEMLCHFPGKGEYFSRNINMPINGSTDWSSYETPFYLKKGENPDIVKLNLVIDGNGTVWIDDVHLKSVPVE